MPVEVTLELNPAFKGDAALIAAAKKKGPFTVDYVTALENIEYSEGLYRIAPVQTKTEVPNVTLEDMTSEQLKVHMLAVGIVPQKQMKRQEVIKAIRAKLAEVEIADDE